MSDERKMYSSIRTYKFANVRKHGPEFTTLPVAGTIIYSSWEKSTDFQTIRGTAFVAATASLNVTILTMDEGDTFYITGSDTTIYTYSASLGATSSLATIFTAMEEGDTFSITGSDTTIYTYSASLGASASLFQTITTMSLGDVFSVTGSDSIIYTFSASQAPLPTDTATLYYFPTGSELSGSVANLKEEINISAASSSVTASSDAFVLNLYTFLTGSDENNTAFQSGSTRNLFTGGRTMLSDTATEFYFDFDTGSLAAAVANLKDEINISVVNSFISSSVITSTLYLFTKETGSAGNSITFQSGSTQNLLTGGSDVPADSGNIYYFDINISRTLNDGVASLKDEINNSAVNSFLTASADSSVLNLYSTFADSLGLIGFQSGTTQWDLDQAAGAESKGTLNIQQAIDTGSVDITGSAITLADSSGIVFDQTLYSSYVRLKYEQTGSVTPSVFRVVSYLIP